MKQIQQYKQKNYIHIKKIYDTLATNQQLQATKIFNYLQEIFIIDQCFFIFNGQNYFNNDDNSTHMQKLIQNYWKNKNQRQKFFMYRVKFTFQEIYGLLQYWINNQKDLTIIYQHYKHQGNQQHQQRQLNQQKSNKQILERKSIENQKNIKVIDQQDDNQFINAKKNISNAIVNYQDQVNTYQLKLKDQQLTHQDRQNIQLKIHDINLKIQNLKKRLHSQSSQSNSPKRLSQISKKPVNYRAIFDFYAKQTHLTGVKATFGRIQHESQSINYQKLVHFLREYDLLPSSPKKQKQIYTLYVKCSSNTRDLNFQGFNKFLNGFSNIIIQNGTPQQKWKNLQQLISQKNKLKANKILNNPFHILERDNFRIESKNIKYQFKILPQKGKLQQQITSQLQIRKQSKQHLKQQLLKQKQQKQKKYLKKLQNIDPFNPILINNPLLLQNKSIQQPIANLDNIQQYRDNSFNIQAYFGINDSNDDIMRDISAQVHSKAKKVQKLELQKMKNLMNGIIQRSQAKMQKLGLSPIKSSRK